MDSLVLSITTESHLELIRLLISAIRIVTFKYLTDITTLGSVKISYQTNQTIFKQVEQLINFINESYQTSYQLVPTDME